MILAPFTITYYHMKKVLLFSLLACGAFSLQAQITESATDAVKNMGVGWNLGNTLDANKGAGKDFNATSYWGQQGLESETYWGQPVTKPELFKMMKEAGFGAIRVPVTWFNHMDKDGNVDKAWMERVHKVVDYVIDNGLYCIINVHHDTGADSKDHASWIKADEKSYDAVKERYEGLWKQIATEFKDYGKELLFESYNEMLDNYSSWCFASFNSPSKYDAASATSSYNAINSYAKSFRDVVRATGGNNETRNLIVNTYAAANGYGNWNTHLTDPLTKLTLPEAAGHMIVEVHAYPNIQSRTIADIKKEVDSMVKLMDDNFGSKDYPAIFGEWGTSNVDAGDGKTDYDARRELMFQFCEYFVQATKAKGMGTFFWMGMSDGLYRSMPAFSQPDLAECVTKAYHGASFSGKYPQPDKVSSVDLITEPMTFVGWGDPRLNIPGAQFKSIGDNIQITLTYTFSGDNTDIQLYYGDWSSKPSFIIGSKTYDGDYDPHDDHDVTETVTTTITFSKEVTAELAKRGLIIFGDKFTLSKAVLSDPSAASIETIETNEASDILYDLSGQRVNRTTHGIYIQGGKKYFVK